MTRRQRAFRQPAPAGWLPEPGDTVWIAAKGMGVVKATATVLWIVGALYVRLKITYGTFSTNESWAIADVRPWSPARQRSR